MSGVDLEARIRRLEDREEISELVYRYTLAVDGWDPEAKLALFTKDARFEYDDYSSTEGEEAMYKWAHRPREKDEIMIHSIDGHLIEFEDEDHATGVVSAHSERCTPNGPIFTSLRYYDKYRRDAGRWRFVERSIRFWYAMPPSDLGASFCGPLRIRIGVDPRRSANYQGYRPTAEPRRASLPYDLESHRRAHGSGGSSKSVAVRG